MADPLRNLYRETVGVFAGQSVTALRGLHSPGGKGGGGRGGGRDEEGGLGRVGGRRIGEEGGFNLFLEHSKKYSFLRMRIVK